MSNIQFAAENQLTFYGTNQIEDCVPFRSAIPEQIVGLVNVAPITTDCVQPPCYTLTVFDEDKSAFLFDYPTITGNALFVLEKLVAAVWTEVANPMGNNEGTLFDIGTIPNYDSYAGFEIDWGNVKDEHGLGSYRFVLPDLTTPANTLYSQPFSLLENTCANKNLTIKLEVINNGSYSNFNYTRDNKLLRNYDLVNLEWSDSVRYFGKLTESEADTTEEYLEFANQSEHLLNVKTKEKFVLVVPEQAIQLLKRIYFFGLEGKSTTITDYNSNNNDNYTKIDIISDGYPTFEKFPRNKLVYNGSFDLAKARTNRFYKC